MFDIFIDSHFSGGHHLRNYPGNCERPHGHNWKVRVTVRADKLDDLGMGVDFRTVKKAVAEVLDDLDHCDLNEHPAFAERNPSSENIAVHIFEQVAARLDCDRYRVHAVTVWETDPCGVTYYGPGRD